MAITELERDHKLERDALRTLLMHARHCAQDLGDLALADALKEAYETFLPDEKAVQGRPPRH